MTGNGGGNIWKKKTDWNEQLSDLSTTIRYLSFRTLC